jgi:hypothetical protein
MRVGFEGGPGASNDRAYFVEHHAFCLGAAAVNPKTSS